METLPADVEGVPRDFEVLPADVEAVPRDFEALPREFEPLPADVGGVPRDFEGSPRGEGREVGREGGEVPREGVEVPREGAEVPREGAEVTREGAEVTREGAEVTRDDLRFARSTPLGGTVRAARARSSAAATGGRALRHDDIRRRDGDALVAVVQRHAAGIGSLSISAGVRENQPPRPMSPPHDTDSAASAQHIQFVAEFCRPVDTALIAAQRSPALRAVYRHFPRPLPVERNRPSRLRSVRSRMIIVERRPVLEVQATQYDPHAKAWSVTCLLLDREVDLGDLLSDAGGKRWMVKSIAMINWRPHSRGVRQYLLSPLEDANPDIGPAPGTAYLEFPNTGRGSSA